MEESSAERVVELLRARNVFASVSRRTGVYRVGVRVVIPDGREALWDNDGAAGLEAMVLRDGVLVGFVPAIADSEDLSEEEIARVIAETEYDAPEAAAPAPQPGTATGTAARAAGTVASGRVPPPLSAAEPRRGWWARRPRRR